MIGYKKVVFCFSLDLITHKNAISALQILCITCCQWFTPMLPLLFNFCFPRQNAIVLARCRFASLPFRVLFSLTCQMPFPVNCLLCGCCPGSLVCATLFFTDAFRSWPFASTWLFPIDYRLLPVHLLLLASGHGFAIGYLLSATLLATSIRLS